MVFYAAMVSYVKADDLSSRKRTMTSILVRQHLVGSRSGRLFFVGLSCLSVKQTESTIEFPMD